MRPSVMGSRCGLSHDGSQTPPQLIPTSRDQFTCCMASCPQQGLEGISHILQLACEPLRPWRKPLPRSTTTIFMGRYARNGTATHSSGDTLSLNAEHLPHGHLVAKRITSCKVRAAADLKLSC